MFEIIEELEDTTQQKLNKLEILYIEKYNSLVPKDITLQDISDGKGFYYVSLPIFENNDTKNIQLQDENTIRINNLEKTIESQKKLIEKIIKGRRTRKERIYYIK